MKSLLRPVLVALALGLALFPALSRAAGPTLEMRVGRLDQLVRLTSQQRRQAAVIFQNEDDALAALNPADGDMKNIEVHQASRDQIRAILAPAQQHIYDRTRQPLGGGLTLALPENRVANLDQKVGLTDAQKAVALQIYQEEFESLLALAPADRPDQGAPFRRASTEQVRAILTSEQLAKMDGGRQATMAQNKAERVALEKVLGDYVGASNNLASRVGSIVSLAPSGSSSTSEAPDGSRKGIAGYSVIGTKGSDALNVIWERASPTAEIKIVRVDEQAVAH